MAKSTNQSVLFSDKVEYIHQNEENKTRCDNGCFSGMFKAVSHAATRVKLWVTEKAQSARSGFQSFRQRLMRREAAPSIIEPANVDPYKFTKDLSLAETLEIAFSELQHDLLQRMEGLENNKKSDPKVLENLVQAQ